MDQKLEELQLNLNQYKQWTKISNEQGILVIFCVCFKNIKKRFYGA